MTPVWDDLNARARGLGTHLLRRAELEALAGLPDIAALATALRRHALLPGVATEVPPPEEIELGLRRWAAGLVRILARWAGPRTAALPLVFDEEDRRSLRAIFRGAAQRAPADRRLAGLIPTPALPERALQELARAPTIAAAGARLSSWRHPYADAVATVAATAEPDLFSLEIALSRASAARATAAARRARGRTMRDFVREAVDLENGSTAVVLAGAGRDIVAGEMFLDGGARVSKGAFERAAATGTSAMAGVRIAAALAPSPYATVFAQSAGDPAALESALMRCRLRGLDRHVRQNPLDALSAVWFALRLRAQLIDLQRIVWTVALNGPRRWLLDQLGTAAA